MLKDLTGPLRLNSEALGGLPTQAVTHPSATILPGAMTSTYHPDTIDITWEGPFAWPGFEAQASLPALPNSAGVYIQGFERHGGYVISGVGVTGRPVAVRLREHTRRFLNGEYTVLDVTAACRGVREEVWHGWGYARAHRDEFQVRRASIEDAVRRQMAAYRIFVADPAPAGGESRLRERLEAALVDALYDQPPPLCDLPDRGTFQARRRRGELPVLVRSACSSLLHGLPAALLV
jgi:hypothetical protein